ncbi:MAG: chorismate synthase [FCB group bacterium]|nr:chorismate synthase [FCB group bacterium]
MLKRLQYLTAGESHGRGLLGILEGLPAGLPVTSEQIDLQLKRRQQGYGRGKRMQIEQDRVQIYSGVRYGLTLGSPIGLLIPNRDWENWQTKMSVDPVNVPTKPITLPRPGHGDLAGALKYGFGDIRNVLERASARETTMRVALGALARTLLEAVGIRLASRVVSIHTAEDTVALPQPVDPVEINQRADASPVRCLDKKCEFKMMKIIDEARENGDSVGGIFEIIATGIPYGLGSGVTGDRKLSSRLSEAVQSINAIKGVEIGLGFESGRKFGSEVHDEIEWQGGHFTRPTNRAGGIEGGMSNGMPIRIRAVMKPIPTLVKSLNSADLVTGEKRPAHKERTDVCAVPAASIVGEAMVALVLADALLEKFGGDSLDQLNAHIRATGVY